MVNEYIKYVDGRLYWIKKPCRKILIGQEAGSKCAGEYLAFKLFGKRYLVHHYVWELHNGPIPDGALLDHINRDKLDNRIENLRLVTPSQNNANTDKGNNRNCYWNSRVGAYQVRVQYQGRFYHAGRYFKDITEARKAAAALRLEVFGEFSPIL